jgi:hypothetical protein
MTGSSFAYLVMWLNHCPSVMCLHLSYGHKITTCCNRDMMVWAVGKALPAGADRSDPAWDNQILRGHQGATTFFFVPILGAHSCRSGTCEAPLLLLHTGIEIRMHSAATLGIYQHAGNLKTLLLINLSQFGALAPQPIILGERPPAALAA